MAERLLVSACALTCCFVATAEAGDPPPTSRVWDVQEITLSAAQSYANPYADVVVWVQLEGPGFSKRVYGFWDAGPVFKVRVAATTPGEWHWTSGSNQPADAGLNGKGGGFTASAWSDAEKNANANRRGFLRATANGHALEYADGTPFFLLGDTWLAASTWRLPFKGVAPAADYVPGPGISFEEAVAFRKRQGFNSISFIAAFPNWAADQRASTFADKNGVFLRNAWEKFGHWSDDGKPTAKDMADEDGQRPFAVLADREGLADFDHINPAYFQSLDRKLRFLSDNGFIAMLEPVRRDACPAWKAYFDFNPSYARFVQYLVSRYGAFNIIFSGIHLDWIPKEYSLTAGEFNAALTRHLETYGPLPYGQPYTTLIDSSTYHRFGHAGQCPWLTMHSVGNKPRHHGIYAWLEEIFRLDPPYPAANLEPYYTGWYHEINRPGGETPEVDSDRDVYFARAQMYGSVLSGGLAGHVHGTGAYDLTSTGEPAGWRPFIWDALRFASGDQMRHLRGFALSEGARYQQLALASDDLSPRKAAEARDDGLDGWAFMMRTPARDLALMYFENRAMRAKVTGLSRAASYRWTWFDPRQGKWLAAVTLTTNASGALAAPHFPGGSDRATTDWAAKLTATPPARDASRRTGPRGRGADGRCSARSMRRSPRHRATR
jgi:hypothetical protein